MDKSIRDAVTVAVINGVQGAAALHTTNTTVSDAGQVASKVLTEVAPIVAHVTNTEPWYQSRVTWGAIIAVAGPLLSVLGVSSDILDPDLAVSISTAVVSVVGGALTLYGRWKARKPIGA